MNAVLANSFTTFFENLFSNWQLVLFAVLTILLILSILFLKFKTAFFIFLAGGIAVAVVLIVDLIIEAVKWDLYAFIDFLIAWAPTVLFSVIVLLSMLINAKRGRRKSLILMAQSASAAILWVLLYYFLVRSVKLETAVVKFVNLFMGENGLQNSLNVSSEATTLRGILALCLESAAGSGTLGALVSDTSAYVYTLADMIYHIGFAAVCLYFYLVTVFILYLIYLCFYSERKYKKKKTMALGENQTDTGYKKHHVGGAVVGLVRGVAAGLVCISFIGAGFFMVAGRGEGRTKDYEAGGKYENQLSIYQSIERYGTQGIFLILNAMSDPNDMPYYLFAADLVFSGALNDEKNGVSENINLREELGSFSVLARDTVTLLLKYGGEEFTASVNGTSEAGIMDSVLNVMKNREFQTEFDALIGEYDSPTYIYNFSMSLVSSVLANIDNMSFSGSLSENNRELVKIIFKEGYLSPYIPEDRVLYELNVRNGAENPWQATGRNVRPYLGMQQLVKKEDVRVFLKTFLAVLSGRGEQTSTFDLIRAVVPNIKELSMFGSNGNTVDPVLARMYCFVQNAYLKAEGAEGYSYSLLVEENVAWTDEISSLLDVAEDFFAIYDDVSEAETAVFNRLLYIFDPDNPNREKDIALYDSVSEKVSVSRLLGKTLATSYFTKTLTDGLGQLFEGVYIPDDIVYENSSAGGGEVTYGELHYFLRGLRHIGCMEDRTILNLLFGGDADEEQSVLSALAEAVKATDAEGKNLAYYASSSGLLRSLVSCFLIGEGEGMIYVPKMALEKNKEGQTVNLVVSVEMEKLLNGIGLIASFMDECVDGDYYDYIDQYLEDSEFMNFIESSRIAEGSLAMHIRDRIAEETDSSQKQLVLSKRLTDSVENWCTVNGIPGELRRFISSYRLIRDGAGYDEDGEYLLNLKNIMDGDQRELILTTVSDFGKGQSEEEKKATINAFFDSEIIYYTVSYYLDSVSLNNLSIVIPVSSKSTLYQDTIESIVKKDELCYLFMGINELGIEDNHDPTDLLARVILNRNVIRGEILSASVVANIVNNNTFCTALRLDRDSLKKYRDTGSVSYLEMGYYNMNPWKAELPRLIDALEILFETKLQEEGFAFNAQAMLGALYDAKDNPLVFQACRFSEIIATGYSAELDLLESGSIMKS